VTANIVAFARYQKFRTTCRLLDNGAIGTSAVVVVSAPDDVFDAEIAK
jgi:hypothetical protein